MEQLSIGTITTPDLYPFPGMFSCVRAARLRPGSGPGAVVEHVLDLELSGPAVDVDRAVWELERICEMARIEAEDPRGDTLYLTAQAASTTSQQRAKILSGWLELPGGAEMRGRGDELARLHLLCDATWLTNQPAWDLVQNLETRTVYNHNYTFNTNELSLHDDLERVFPGGGWKLVYKQNGSPTGPMTLYVGQLRNQRYGVKLNYRMAEISAAVGEGVTKTMPGDASSSGGTYGRFSWSAAAGWVFNRVVILTLTAAELQGQAGKGYKTMLRTAGALAERMLAKFTITYLEGGVVDRVVWESDPFYLETGRELHEGPVVFLPPWLMGEGDVNNVPLRLNIYLGTNGAGVKTFNVDYLGLLPMDGWRIYRPMLNTWGLDIIDSGDPRSSGGAQTHRAEGPGFVLMPKEDMLFVFYCCIETPTGNTASVALNGDVKILARAERRNL